MGPNCLGVINTDPAVRLDASLTPRPPHPGGLAVASQSGAIGATILDHASRSGCGISSFVSLGNKADVSGNDLIAYWYEDPATTAVALYLESFGNPRKFARIARALARRKPVLAVFSGGSTAGRRAGVAHTAAAGASHATVDVLFAQAGVVRAGDLGELIDAARILTDQPLPRGDRLAIVGTAGGANVLAADAADREGLTLPARVADRDNPLDLGPEVSPEALSEAVSALAASGEVDAVLAVVAATRANDPTALTGAVAAVADCHPDLPMAVVALGAPVAAALGERQVPVYDLPERAVRAFGHAARYAAWRREPLGSRPPLTNVDEGAGRVLVRSALSEGDGWQPPDRVAAILSCYGIPLPTHVEEPGQPGTDMVELIAGITHDALFGSLVMVGLGGPYADLVGDRAFRLVPVTDLDAGRMWRSLRAAPLLTGDRHRSGADIAGLEDLLLRLGRLAEDLPEVAQLDLDPVVVGPDGIAVGGARLKLIPAGEEPDPTLRRLR